MTRIKDDGQVEFRFYRPGAAQVKLAGDFTGWQRGAATMSGGEDGWWTAVARLCGGEYQFRYIADGIWFTDFASNGIEITRHGWNSVLVVPGEEPGGSKNSIEGEDAPPYTAASAG